MTADEAERQRSIAALSRNGSECVPTGGAVSLRGGTAHVADVRREWCYYVSIKNCISGDEL